MAPEERRARRLDGVALRPARRALRATASAFSAIDFATAHRGSASAGSRSSRTANADRSAAAPACACTAAAADKSENPQSFRLFFRRRYGLRSTPGRRRVRRRAQPPAQAPDSAQRRAALADAGLPVSLRQPARVRRRPRARQHHAGDASGALLSERPLRRRVRPHRALRREGLVRGPRRPPREHGRRRPQSALEGGAGRQAAADARGRQARGPRQHDALVHRRDLQRQPRRLPGPRAVHGSRTRGPRRGSG